ncbi:MAG: glutamate--tRNA ligase [Methanomassiliicoccaceae archaeon]|jgi:glutamyl-tRNA synthetase|nr:glutamate--tRNA ligase [Methanomassiliicoccaceae archaeon]
MSDPVQDTIRKYALQNAVFFKGTANPKAVVGKVLGECPELRSRSAEITPLIESIVSDVNKMGLEAQTKELQSSDPNLMVKEKKERIYELPALEGAEKGVVMRIAPGPSGPLHIGHSRVSVLNDEYVKRYGGKLINRFEDTNPEKIAPEAYDMIPEDLDWLGVKIHETIVQSDRFEIYYDITRKLIEAGKAYVCTCDAEDWRNLKENMNACPCRELPIEEQMERYDRMLSNGYKEGEAIAVVKTDLRHPNPAVRDFVALRIVDHPHPRVGTKYNIYPMMNLSVAIDDHMFGMTHVIRGKDHLNNTFRQEYIYNYMKWKKPHFYHYGLVSIPESVLKTSIIKKGIKDGDYTGWDDVRTGTLRAMKKRGIRPEAIRRYWVESGIKPIDIQFTWDTLYAMNRDIIDDKANRYFFVQDPKEFKITGIEEIVGKAPMHPDHPERGSRDYSLSGDIRVSISAQDAVNFIDAGTIRLKDLCNIEFSEPAKYAGTDLSILKKGVRAVQWVSSGIPTEVHMPDGTILNGISETALSGEKGEMVQFERVGFVRLDKNDKNCVKAVFAHR